MTKTKRKIISLALICALSGTSAMAVSESCDKEAEAFAALGYVAAKRGASPEVGLAISVAAVIQGGIDGAVYGAVFGGGAGLAAGIIVGM